MTVDASWRGIATEQVDEVSAPLAALLRKRSRLLLADLLRPHRRGGRGPPWRSWSRRWPRWPDPG